MFKVLVVAYYFPPMGLSGVQNIKQATGTIFTNFNLKGFLEHLTDKNKIQQTQLSGAIKVEDVNLDLESLNYPLKNLINRIFYFCHYSFRS